ncbi:MAG: hypothetical protein Q4Q53_08540 [Methanocorpusculum sp.]|nr:hypothetical protein [Methanocorpusculum sp.]
MKQIKNHFILILALTSLLICAGCITDEPAVKTTAVEIPEDMNQAFEDLSNDIASIGHNTLSEMTDIAKDVGVMNTHDDITHYLSDYYSQNPGLTAIVFSDALHGGYISVPVMLDIDLSDYSKQLTEQDFKDSNGLIIRTNVFTKYHGYINIYYKPVYTKDGEYHGYLAFVTDFYSMLYLADNLGTKRSYGNYVCFVTDSGNNILYSSINEASANVIPKESGYFDRTVYIPDVKSEKGACQYTSRELYIYNPSVKTEKITAWRQYYYGNGKYHTIYLVKELNQPELNYENASALNAEDMIYDVRDAFNYASVYGKEKCIKHINSGYYDSLMFVVDMKGNVIAASKGRTGENYMNNRGVYGYSYMQAAVNTAEQGGGYIYYTVPVERTVFPRAAIYTIGVIMPIDNSCFIYGVITGAADAIEIDYNMRPDITTLSRALVKDASVMGIDYVISTITDNGKNAAEIFAPNLTTDISDIAVLDMDGKLYASVVYPELAGDSVTGLGGLYGGSFTRLSLMLAKAGSGFMTYMLPNEDKEGYVDLYLAMVQPINDEYYTFASVLVNSFEDLLTPVLDNVKLVE